MTDKARALFWCSRGWANNNRVVQSVGHFSKLPHGPCFCGSEASETECETGSANLGLPCFFFCLFSIGAKDLASTVIWCDCLSRKLCVMNGLQK